MQDGSSRWTRFKQVLALGALGATQQLADLVSVAVQGMPLFYDSPIARHILTGAIVCLFLAAVLYSILPNRDGDAWADIIDPDPDTYTPPPWSQEYRRRFRRGRGSDDYSPPPEDNRQRGERLPRDSTGNPDTEDDVSGRDQGRGRIA